MILNAIHPGATRPKLSPTFGSPQLLQTPSGEAFYAILDNEVVPSQAEGLVLYFHGNGELVEDLEYVLPFFRRAQLLTVLVEYPGYGHGPGSPSEKTLYQTALKAYDWAHQQYSHLPIYAAGWSLGSSVATYLASTRALKHLLLLSAMSSMKAVAHHLFPFLPSFFLKGNEFQTVHFIKQVKTPITLIHGTEDDLVPFQMAEELKKRMGSQLNLIGISGATHNDLFFRGEKIIQEEILKITQKI